MPQAKTQNNTCESSCPIRFSSTTLHVSVYRLSGKLSVGVTSRMVNAGLRPTSSTKCEDIIGASKIFI